MCARAKSPQITPDYNWWLVATSAPLCWCGVFLFYALWLETFNSPKTLCECKDPKYGRRGCTSLKDGKFLWMISNVHGIQRKHLQTWLQTVVAKLELVHIFHLEWYMATGYLSNISSFIPLFTTMECLSISQNVFKHSNAMETEMSLKKFQLSDENPVRPLQVNSIWHFSKLLNARVQPFNVSVLGAWFGRPFLNELTRPPKCLIREWTCELSGSGTAGIQTVL